MSVAKLSRRRQGKVGCSFLFHIHLRRLPAKTEVERRVSRRSEVTGEKHQPTVVDEL